MQIQKPLGYLFRAWRCSTVQAAEISLLVRSSSKLDQTYFVSGRRDGTTCPGIIAYLRYVLGDGVRGRFGSWRKSSISSAPSHPGGAAPAPTGQKQAEGLLPSRASPYGRLIHLCWAGGLENRLARTFGSWEYRRDLGVKSNTLCKKRVV